MAREVVSCMGLESDFGFEHGVHGSYGAFGADIAATPPQIVIQSAAASRETSDFKTVGTLLGGGIVGAILMAYARNKPWYPFK
jgi:hypothetical protein